MLGQKLDRYRIESKLGEGGISLVYRALDTRLVVHDRDDDDTDWSDGDALAKAWPGAQMITTSGLGHRRILREPSVVEAVTSFVAG